MIDPNVFGNPLALLKLLETPEGQAAAAVHLASTGANPEDFVKAVAGNPAAGGTANPPKGDTNVSSGFDSLFGFGSPANLASAPGFPAAAASPVAGGSPAVSAPGANPWLNPQFIQQLLQSGVGMVGAAQPPQAHILQPYAPAPHAQASITQSNLPQFLQVLLAGTPQAQQQQSLGALFRAGGL